MLGAGVVRIENHLRTAQLPQVSNSRFQRFRLRFVCLLLLGLSAVGVWQSSIRVAERQTPWKNRNKNAQEKITPAFVNEGHPRTAIAKQASGKPVLIIVDGRQASESIGMSLTTLADLLLELGAVEAMNLDGGGSTTMVVHNKVVNKPSDQTGERPVSDAILVFSKPK
jgi:hypothetical protein